MLLSIQTETFHGDLGKFEVFDIQESDVVTLFQFHQIPTCQFVCHFNLVAFPVISLLGNLEFLSDTSIPHSRFSQGGMDGASWHAR
jgi:hypothetical protein